MNRIQEVFGLSPVVLPVIHPVGYDEVLKSVRVVSQAGVPGIFLINQGMGIAKILLLINELHKRYPDLWIGVNLLGTTPSEALGWAINGCHGKIDGIWSDNACVDERTQEQPLAEEFILSREQLD